MKMRKLRNYLIVFSFTALSFIIREFNYWINANIEAITMFFIISIPSLIIANIISWSIRYRKLKSKN